MRRVPSQLGVQRAKALLLYRADHRERERLALLADLSPNHVTLKELQDRSGSSERPVQFNFFGGTRLTTYQFLLRGLRQILGFERMTIDGTHLL